MITRLDRKTIVQLYCLFSETERSIHRVLDPAATWSEFQQYYSMQKRASVGRALGSLLQIVRPVAELPPRMKYEMINALRSPGLFRVLFGRWSARWKSSWTFSVPEIHVLAWTGQTFLCCLEKMDKPDANLLISLRKDCYLCETIIACRCFGMREIKESTSIAHFRQSEWLKTVPGKDRDEAA